MKIVNFIQKIKSLPVKSQRLLGLGVVVMMFIALPLFIWAINTQEYKTQNKAASGEPENTINCTTGMSDNFNTAGINSTKWTATSNVVVQNGTLKISGLPGEDTSHNLMSNLWVDGDFQAQVDVKQFEASTAGVNALATAELKAYGDSGNFFTIRWVKWTETNSQVNLYSSVSGHVTQGVGVTLPASAAPTLRLVRNGSVVHGYYNTGAGFQELPGISATIYPGPVKPTIFAYKRGPAATTAVFDNFSLGCIGSVTPTPSARPNPTDCTPRGRTITVTPEGGAGRCHNIQTAIDRVKTSGYTVLIQPGTYNLSGTINVNGKQALTITGNPEGSVDVTTLNFTPNGWGFLIQNSSGSLKLLNIKGGSSNGMISIKNSSNFQLDYLKVDSNSSHTIDVQGSSNVNISNSEITSSAGALEVQNSTLTTIQNNKIHNSANGVSIYNSDGTAMAGNLITTNRESGLVITNGSNFDISHNTILNNSNNSHSPGVDLRGTINSLNFNNNMVVYNYSSGINYTGSGFTRTFGHNDVWNNTGENYSGFDNYTGINGNISQDPLINFNNWLNLCLNPGSPAIYGNPNNYEYMGYAGLCRSGGSTPSPSPAGKPDLVVSSITIERADPPFLPCRSYMYRVSVVNNGTAPAPTSRLKITVSPAQTQLVNMQDGCTSPQNYSGADVPVPQGPDRLVLNPGDGETYNDYFNPSQDGTVTITAQIDSNNQISELSENNNSKTSTFNVVKLYPTSDPITGDVNGDGHVNIIDIGILIDNYRMSPPTNPKADLNNDGVVNIVDIGIIVDHYEL